jgi:hypothetical protein
LIVHGEIIEKLLYSLSPPCSPRFCLFKARSLQVGIIRRYLAHEIGGLWELRISSHVRLII